MPTLSSVIVEWKTVGGLGSRESATRETASFSSADFSFTGILVPPWDEPFYPVLVKVASRKKPPGLLRAASCCQTYTQAQSMSS